MLEDSLSQTSTLDKGEIGNKTPSQELRGFEAFAGFPHLIFVLLNLDQYLKFFSVLPWI